MSPKQERKSKPKSVRTPNEELPPVRREKRKIDKLREEIMQGLDELDEMIRNGD